MRFKFLTLLFVLFSFCCPYAIALDDTGSFMDLYYEVIESDTSRVEDLRQCYTFFKQKNDSIWMTRSLIGMSDHETKEGNYGSSFACLWEGLAYAEGKNDLQLLYQIHSKLSLLYSIFDRENEAFSHKEKTLEYARNGYQTGVLNGGALVSSFYSMMLYYRKLEMDKESQMALDSCYYYSDLMKFSADEKAYLFLEEGHILMRQGRVDEALVIFSQSEQTFKKIYPGYLSIVYSYIGKTYGYQQLWSNAELYFRKSIQIVDTTHTHFDVKVESLGYLAESLSKQHKYKDAYRALEDAKVLNEELFSAKGLKNQGLFDIRNMYQEKVEERDRIILERDKELIQQRAQNLRIRLFLIAVIASVLLIVLYWYFNYTRRKLLAEKKNQRLESEREYEKNRVLVDMKNRELTSFTLQLIDKDSLIKDIVDAVNRLAPHNEKLLRAVKLETTGRLKLWEEFDKRFVDVNRGFYQKLKFRFPDLTRTELKHCALVKLNFSAKEMAQLLNISINGVNTSRYRIRKKLGLEREENLPKFIDSI